MFQVRQKVLFVPTCGSLPVPLLCRAQLGFWQHFFCLALSTVSGAAAGGGVVLALQAST